jgi:hypothetical protein
MDSWKTAVQSGENPNKTHVSYDWENMYQAIDKIIIQKGHSREFDRFWASFVDLDLRRELIHNLYLHMSRAGQHSMSEYYVRGPPPPQDDFLRLV